jgi:hypothetical protein
VVPAVKCADDPNNQSAVMRLVDVAPSSVAQFRFYEDLNDFLAPAFRKSELPYALTDTPSVEDAIEAIGQPSRNFRAAAPLLPTNTRLLVAASFLIAASIRLASD